MMDYYNRADFRMRILELASQKSDGLNPRQLLAYANDLYEWAVAENTGDEEPADDARPCGCDCGGCDDLDDLVEVDDNAVIGVEEIAVLQLELELEYGSLDDVFIRFGTGQDTEVSPFSLVEDVYNVVHGSGTVGTIYTFNLLAPDSFARAAQIIEGPDSSVFVHSRSVRAATEEEIDTYYDLVADATDAD